MKEMIDGIRLTRTLVSQSAWDEYRREELAPGPDVTSDSEIEAFVRQATGTSYHPSGTCRMGVDPDAVVDGDGKVRRVRRLRVVDASIMPKVITGNLNAPVMMMAEKISDRIRGTALPPSKARVLPGRSRAGGLIAGRSCIGVRRHCALLLAPRLQELLRRGPVEQHDDRQRKRFIHNHSGQSRSFGIGSSLAQLTGLVFARFGYRTNRALSMSLRSSSRGGRRSRR